MFAIAVGHDSPLHLAGYYTRPVYLKISGYTHCDKLPLIGVLSTTGALNVGAGGRAMKIAYSSREPDANNLCMAFLPQPTSALFWSFEWDLIATQSILHSFALGVWSRVTIRLHCGCFP